MDGVVSLSYVIRGRYTPDLVMECIGVLKVLGVSPLSLQEAPEIVQALRQSRMGEYRILQNAVMKLAEHSSLNNTHNLTAFNTQAAESEDLTRLNVNNSFHQTLAFVRLQRTCNVAHWHGCSLDRQISVLLSRFPLV